MLAPSPTRIAPNRRVYKVLLASAACVAVLAGVFVIKQSNDSQDAGGLRDVDPSEALPLAEAAQIATACEEQSSVTEEIARNISDIRDLSNDAAANSAESMHASQQLSALSQNLAALVGRFRT